MCFDSLDDSFLIIYSRFSASNASRVYENSKTDHSYFQPSEWSLSNRLTTNHIWDSFVLLGLLEDAVLQGHLLAVPHTGTQSDRFKAAMEKRNRFIVLNGQPDAVRHACNKCMCVFSGWSLKSLSDIGAINENDRYIKVLSVYNRFMCRFFRLVF